ncbi:DHH family phosphoesterase [Ruficoccus sp. ZRK36]|uniref:DHH family phosphoesterase n=1 Tax=Ruficoccus sp. ZRK36 TaxID=2866311 RepID=UPI001C72BB0E|nr:DHH family phosphoesterase [Ruficoccus sp. ZRK36]QYY35338.1 DHH family phosphoesterase [Ruficoccus sp. ZRK36]
MYFPHLSESFLQLLSELRGKPVAVLGHLRPDGDCIGSQVALTRVLRTQGVDAIAVNRDEAPRVMQAFIADTPWAQAKDFDPQGHLSVNVDCADPIRVGMLLEKKFPETFANIDHHVSNPNYARHNFVEPSTAATAEVLTGLFFDHDLPVDAVTAQALYVGISTDTGQFRFPTTSGQVFELCARLCACGASAGGVARELFEREPLAKLKLLQRFLGTLKLVHGERICIGTLREKDFEETGAAHEDAEGFVDYARDLDGVDIGIFVQEFENQVKGSLRAKTRNYRLDRLARKFGGGGHAPAAGFNQHRPLEEVCDLLLKAAAEHLDAIDNTPAS